MGATRDVCNIDIPIRGICINALADADASHTLVGSDSGTIFVNKYTTTTTYTLPSLVDGTGKIFWFFNAQSTGEIAITAPSDCMIGEDSTYTTLTTTSNTSGDGGFVVCDGTSYYFFALQGTWNGS
jgi:hypothetical protein